MTPGIYPIGEPDRTSPLVVTTNFSLTYFIVSTEVEATGVASHLAVVDAEGMSVLTAWSAGKFSGDRVGKQLRELGATERVDHRTVIIPGYVAMISGELEDALGGGWRVITGPRKRPTSALLPGRLDGRAVTACRVSYVVCRMSYVAGRMLDVPNIGQRDSVTPDIRPTTAYEPVFGLRSTVCGLGP